MGPVFEKFEFPAGTKEVLEISTLEWLAGGGTVSSFEVDVTGTPFLVTDLIIGDGVVQFSIEIPDDTAKNTYRIPVIIETTNPARRSPQSFFLKVK